MWQMRSIAVELGGQKSIFFFDVGVKTGVSNFSIFGKKNNRFVFFDFGVENRFTALKIDFFFFEIFFDFFLL